MPPRISTIARVTMTDDALSLIMKKAFVAPTTSPSRREIAMRTGSEKGR